MRDDARARRTKKAAHGAPERPTAAYKSRHARKCSVCNHPDLEFINDDYLRWRSPEKIARDYRIAHHSAVYRHAAATGLRRERRANLRATLENFIERADSVRVTADSVIRAAQIYAQINDDGQWAPSPKRHIVEYRHASAPADAASVASSATPLAAQKRASSGRNTARMPSSATSTAAHKRATSEAQTAGVSPAPTLAAISAAPLRASAQKFPAVRPAKRAASDRDAVGVASSATSTAAHSAAPSAQAK